MRDYTLKSYGLTNEIANQVLWLVRDYKRMKTEYNNTIWDSPDPPDGQPRGNSIGDSTSRKAIKMAELFRKLEAIERSKLEIPEQYREGVWNNLLYKTPYPAGADRTTWWRQKTRFVHRVAEKMFWV
ncbi:MAG: hypothetical protein RSD65_06275 [Anaerovoracaceae bacterium]